MTVTIARHGVAIPDTERFVERLGEAVARDIDELEESTEMIDFAFPSAVTALQARCVDDPEASAVETWEAAVSAMQLGSALFAVSEASEGHVECRINHKMRRLPATGRLSAADAGNWLTAFWLAVICRDQQRMTQLCEIPVERLRAPEGHYDEYIYHWVDTLQTYWLRRPGLVEKLTVTLQSSDASVARIAPRDLLQGVLYPPINLFYNFVRRNEAGFGSALEEALKLHRLYWTLDESRETDIDGAVALGPLAVACLAYDGGFPIGIESGYLPKHLLQRDWLGEFPT
ncbi:immunity 49 family protein [Streptomyces ossamyceticus]|uniref:Immunity 49 family protein n=1 Tax=Streptomyces ossamyceticus TaxID=249581 RepID=A0ABV2UVM8_9ACTN